MAIVRWSWNVQIEKLFVHLSQDLSPLKNFINGACHNEVIQALQLHQQHLRLKLRIEKKIKTKEFFFVLVTFCFAVSKLFFRSFSFFQFHVENNEEILIGRAQRRKQLQKYFYNFNFYGLLHSLKTWSRQGKSDCSRWTTESNWQLLNQSCDDDFCNKTKKKFQPRVFSSRARGHSRKNNEKIYTFQILSAPNEVFPFSWAWIWFQERKRKEKLGFINTCRTWGRIVVVRTLACILPENCTLICLREALLLHKMCDMSEKLIVNSCTHFLPLYGYDESWWGYLTLYYNFSKHSTERSFSENFDDTIARQNGQ